MTSCATIFNSPYKHVTIHTTEPSKIIYNQDTINTIDNKTHLIVERNWETLNIVATTDSITKSIRIGAKNSIMYWSNIMFNYGLGMLVDMENPKRYSYPDKIFINSTDATGRYSHFGQANNSGELYLHLSLPMINPFRMAVENEEIKSMTGFFGITIGFDYYHSKDQFVHFGISGLSGGISLKKRGGSYNDELESLTSEYISLSNNHKIERFSIGYGLSCAKNTCTHSKLSWFFGFPFDRVEKSHYALGMVFPIYYQIGEYFNFGVVYRPTFFRPNMANMFVYEHLISIDFAWKIRLMR
jgi:hypothetical protein